MIESSLKSLLMANVPRYTSYPTANHFQDGEGAKLASALHEAAREAESVSVYIHIPYCDRMCWFCGCHTKHTLSYDPIKSYMRALGKEFAILKQSIGAKPKLARLHLGGGSPSLLRCDDLKILRKYLESAFSLLPDAEIAIEIDPSDLTPEGVDDFAAFGMTRASIGVQDFDPVVQKAINRVQSFEQTCRIINALRARGIGSINIDMLYGLPFQTPERLNDTTLKVLSLSPDRIALFGYAHVPWMKPHQRLIPEQALPGTDQRFADASAAAALIMATGYQQIGIDHFAKAEDSLAVAARTGRLHRNFQGYVADECSVLIGLGSSSISRFPGGYVQNEIATGRYMAAIEAGALPYDRGISITEDDTVRAWMIEQIMCQFGFRKSDLAHRFNGRSNHYWSLAEEILKSDIGSLVEVDNDHFALKPHARLFARSIAARVDSRFNPDGAQHSVAV